MSGPSPIEWTDATWNPVGGCSPKSPGCVPCYAQKLAGTRLKHLPLYAGTTDMVKGKPVFNGTMTALPADHPTWTWPLRWSGSRTPLLGAGKPSLIFVADMSDLTHENRPTADIDNVIRAIAYSRHIGQLLTKRPEVMASYFEQLLANEVWRGWRHPLTGAREFFSWTPDQFTDLLARRFWFGFSAERQQEFDARWRHMWRFATIGFTIFVSYEPALGPLKLPADFLKLGRRAQVIAGGVSGRDADTPPHPLWFCDVRDQCLPAGVAFFLKQWGEFHPSDQHAPSACGQLHTPAAIHLSGDRERRPAEAFKLIAELGNGWTGMCRIGKARAGRLLDGVEHNGMPELRA